MLKINKSEYQNKERWVKLSKTVSEDKLPFE